MELPDLLVQAPLWQWATLASLALGLVVALYGWGNEVPRPRWVLAVLRLATLSILGFLLLEPVWRTTTETRERPMLPVLVDATSSQWLGPDSVERRAALVEAMTQWSRWGTQAEWDVEVFEFDRDVREVALAEGLPWNPQGKRTDLGGALEDMRDRYVHRNVPAVVVVTDGRANRGVDPEFGASKLEVPHFVVATGDTSDVNDLVLAKLRMNEVAYLGNAFPVEVTAQARGAQGVPLRLRLESQGKVLGETAWTPESELASTTWSVTVDATEAGRQRLTARIAVPGAWEGEVTTVNNQRTASIEILESRRTVLVVAAAPHPDVAALRLAAEGNRHQETSVLWIDELRAGQSLPTHDVLVLHHLDPAALPSPVLDALESTRAVWILGSKGTEWNTWGVERVGFRLDNEPLVTEAQGAPVAPFDPFPLPANMRGALATWPPLACPTGTYDATPTLQPALVQQVGPVTTTWPLWAVREGSQRQRMAVTLGEGLWRWRMLDLAANEGKPGVFDDLVNLTLQYLSSRDDVRRLRVTAPEQVDEDVRLELQAEVYDLSLTPTTEADVRLTLTPQGGAPTTHRFVPGRADYQLDLGRLLPGVYTWSAACVQNGETLTEQGSFVVHAVQAEASLVAANHAMLRRLAVRTQGAVLGTLDAPEDLATLRNAWEAVAPTLQAAEVIHASTERLPLHRQAWLLALLIVLLSAEWAVRRAGGGF